MNSSQWLQPGGPSLIGGGRSGRGTESAAMLAEKLAPGWCPVLADVNCRKPFQGSFALCSAGRLDPQEALASGRSQGLPISTYLLEGGPTS